MAVVFAESIEAGLVGDGRLLLYHGLSEGCVEIQNCSMGLRSDTLHVFWHNNQHTGFHSLRKGNVSTSPLSCIHSISKTSLSLS